MNKKLNIKKVIIVAIIAILVIVIALIYKITKKEEVIQTSIEPRYLGAEEIIQPVEEEIIVVAKDIEEDNKNEKEEKEEKVTFKNKTVTVPKSTVSSGNSKEDSERSKKTGGQVVTQEKIDEVIQESRPNVKGIDVSEHQGRINWAQVAESGVEFAMIRCGYRGNSLGGIYEDAYFKTNVTGARAAGIKIGIYFYSTAINEDEALEEAAWVVKKIAPYGITFPVVYDFEDFGAYRCADVNGSVATKNALTFIQYVKANGYEPMMYANKNDITTKLSRSSFSCKFWLAHYTTKTNYTGSYDMWQYTSKGSVPGISGNVDMNIAYFNYDKIAVAKHEHKYETFVENKVNATCIKEGIKIMKCTCGEKKEMVLEKSDHKYGEWIIVKEATENKLGTRKKICELCKAEKIEEYKLITETNTNVSNNTTNVTNSVNTSNTITNTTSGNIVNENTTNNNINENTINNNTNENTTNTVNQHIQHDYTANYNIIKNPTCVENGEKVGVCQCGEKAPTTTIIPATGIHEYINGKCVCGGVQNEVD